jgi:hypothetical protein
MGCVFAQSDVLHWSATLEKLALNMNKEAENKAEAAKAAARAKRKDDKDKAAADKLADVADRLPGASLKNTKREAEKGIAGMEEQVNDAVQVQQVTVEQAEVQVKAAAERLRESSERRKEAVCAQLRMLAPLITRIEKHVSPAVREAVDYDRVLYLCARVPALSDDKLASIARIDNVHDSDDDSDTGISSDEEQQVCDDDQEEMLRSYMCAAVFVFSMNMHA